MQHTWTLIAAGEMATPCNGLALPGSPCDEVMSLRQWMRCSANVTVLYQCFDPAFVPFVSQWQSLQAIINSAIQFAVCFHAFQALLWKAATSLPHPHRAALHSFYVLAGGTCCGAMAGPSGSRDRGARRAHSMGGSTFASRIFFHGQTLALPGAWLLP